jgi:nitroreductase
MHVIEAIRSRRAVRDYLSRPVEKSLVEWLIETAVLAPSSMNRQPWSFTVVTDQALLKRMSDAAKAHMLATLSASSELASHRDSLSDPKFNIFYNASTLVVTSATAADQMARYDCCLAAENLMLAARACGLGSCWIGFAESWLNLPVGKAALGIPDGQTVIAPIIIGHPATHPKSTPRRPAEIRWIGHVESAYGAEAQPEFA